MGGPNSFRSWAGPVLAAFALIFFFVLFLLLDHPETAVLLFSLPNPAAFACNLRCLGIGPTLQVIGEGGRAVLMLVLSAAFIYAAVRAVFRVLRTWTFLDAAESRAVPDAEADAAIVPAGTVVFREPHPLAFSAGFVRPNIYVSTGLIKILTAEELRGVVLHERHHCRARDPLKGLLASFISDFLFFVPASGFLARARTLAAEIAADAHSLAGNVEAADLAGSLLKVRAAAGPSVAGFFDPTAERTKRLLGVPSSVRPPLARFVFSALVLAAAALLAAVPIRKSVSDLFLNHDKTCVLRSGPPSGAEAAHAETPR